MDLLIDAPKPGYSARPYARLAGVNSRRVYKGGFVDLSDPEAATHQLRYLANTIKVTHADIVVGTDKDQKVGNIDLVSPVTIALAAPAEPATTMSHQPVYAAAPVQQQQQSASLDTYLLHLQEQRVADARELNAELKDQLRIERETNRTLQVALDKANMEALTLARKYELDLRDATAKAIEEAAPAPPTGAAGVLHGLQGLPAPASEAIVNGFMGMLGPFVQNFLGGAGGGAAAGAAASHLTLPAGTSPQMAQVAVAATEIFQSEEQATLAMTAMQQIVGNEQKFNQFLKLAGYVGEPQPQT